VSLDLSLYDKILENRVRLQIMSVLVANDHYDFNSLKELLEVTDGNLASNVKSLEKEGYITVEKTFVDRKPNTKYRKTDKGQQAFENHLAALENLIKQQYK
jgi:DNA-binding MarR family transcriptional regulator